VPEYSAIVIDHFRNPRNLGDLDGADAVAEVENPACGDRTRLAIRVAGGRIVESRFRTEGCPAAIAASSITTELIQGKTLEEAARLRDEDVAAALGGLPRNKLHCSVLAEDVIQAVLEEYRRRVGPLTPPGPGPLRSAHSPASPSRGEGSADRRDPASLRSASAGRGGHEVGGRVGRGGSAEGMA
jgi:nitrogen fixation NifU-like protein